MDSARSEVLELYESKVNIKGSSKCFGRQAGRPVVLFLCPLTFVLPPYFCGAPYLCGAIVVPFTNIFLYQIKPLPIISDFGAPYQMALFIGCEALKSAALFCAIQGSS